MNSSDHPVDPDTPLDDVDAAVMADLRQYWDTVDPVPSWLVNQVEFAVGLDAIDVEVARLVEIGQLAATRTEEPTPTITFRSDRLNIMITIGPGKEGHIRIDGWLAPAATHRVELRTTTGSTYTAADEHGRFSFEIAPVRNAQFVVQLAGTSGSVVTPSISL